MLAGLVYCQVDRNNPKTAGQNDRKVVAEGLKDVIPTISPVQTGTYSHPETTYCNDAGGGLLSRFRKMEGEMNRLGALEAEVNRLKALEGEVNRLKPLEAEVIMLRPLRKSAVGIRARFFATSRVHPGMGGIGRQTCIDDGNEIAHRGDVVTDICLLRHGLIECHTTFKYLYGMDWRVAMNLIGKLINCF